MQNHELAQMILNVIVQIPKGKVASYGQVAKYAGLPKHARLVGVYWDNFQKIMIFRGIGSSTHKVVSV